MLISATALSFISFLSLVQAHGFIQEIAGANGKKANGFGVNPADIGPGDEKPVSVFKDKTAPCGVGVAAGKIDIATSIEAAITAGLPTTDATGSISMIWQQITNGNDGGGPGTAAIDVTGTGNSFKPLTITKNFADGGANSANPMTIQLAAGTACAGGSNKATCLVKVTNSAGPFGSCFAIASGAAGGGGAAVVPASSAAAPSPPVAKAKDGKKHHQDKAKNGKKHHQVRAKDEKKQTVAKAKDGKKHDDKAKDDKKHHDDKAKDDKKHHQDKAKDGKKHHDDKAKDGKKQDKAKDEKKQDDEHKPAQHATRGVRGVIYRVRD